MTLSANEITDLAIYRWNLPDFQQKRQEWDVLSAIYAGRHIDLFPDEFPADALPKIAGFIRRSWRMFARHVGQVPTVYMSPLTETTKGLRQQERMEMLCRGYHDVWGMEMKMKALATFMVGFGAVGMGCIPDPRRKFPMFLVEDPRNVLPGAGWDSTSTSQGNFLGTNTLMLTQDQGGGMLQDCIIRKTMLGSQVLKQFPDSGASAVIKGDDPTARARSYSVFMYYDDKNCTVVLSGTNIILAQAPHGAPWCPWWFPTNFGPDQPAGDSDYYQQIGIEVAFAALLNQKLSLNDSMVWPWVAETGNWERFPDERRMVATSPDAKIQTLTPPAQTQVDRDMAMLQDVLRMLNMETEATQGSLPGGPITGQGIQQLNQAPIVDTVQGYFTQLGFFLPRVYATALIQDRTVFPTVTKDLSGWALGETFFTTYTPGIDIQPSLGKIKTDFGPGLGGYQGHIAQLQDLGADTYSKTSVMEHNPNIRSVRAEKARVFREKLEAMVIPAMMGQAAVPLDYLARFDEAVGSGIAPMDFLKDNPPGQATATPGNTSPMPPDIAAAAAQAGGGGGPGGPPGGGSPAPLPPGGPGASAGGIGPGPNVWGPPRLAKLMGS